MTIDRALTRQIHSAEESEGASRRRIAEVLFEATALHSGIHTRSIQPAESGTGRSNLRKGSPHRRSAEPAQILLVSEDRPFRTTMRSFLEHSGFQVRCCAEAGRAPEILRHDTGTDLMLVDVHSEEPGVRLLHELEGMPAAPPAIAIFGPENQAVPASAPEKPNWTFVNQPVVLSELLGLIWQALEPPVTTCGHGTRMQATPSAGGGVARLLRQSSQRTAGHLAHQPELAYGAYREQRAARNRVMNPRKGVRILSICDDDGIRFSRELVLLQEGYEVESIPSNAFLEANWVRSFHIAVLCHSLNAERAARIADTLRAANPAIRVLRVHSIRSCFDHYFDVDCEALPGPTELLLAIASLAKPAQTGQQQTARRPA